MTRSLQSGFTLVELVIVIVILGILATVAIPAYVDMRTQAWAANVAGVGGAIASASATNYAGCVAGALPCVTVAKCSDSPKALVGGAFPTAPSGSTTYAWAADTAISPGGTAGSCTLQLKNGSTVQASTTINVIAAP